MARNIDLDSDRVLFRRVKGKIVPIRISAKSRFKEGLEQGIAPALVGGAISEIGIGLLTGVKRKKRLFRPKPSLFKTTAKAFSVSRFGKIALGTIAFSAAYRTIFGKGHKNVIRDETKKSQTRIVLASKPAFFRGHPFAHHSYLAVIDKKGYNVYGGQIKNALKYGKSGIGLKRNFESDKISRATDIYDITPKTEAQARKAASRIRKEADVLQKQLKKKDFKYRSIPISKKRYNSNSVPATLMHRAGLKKPRTMVTSLPGFERIIPERNK